MKKCEIRKNIRHAAASIKPAVSYLYGTVAIGLPGAVLFNLSARHSGPVGAVWLLVTAIAMTAGAMVYLAVHKRWNKLSIKTIKGTIRSNGLKVVDEEWLRKNLQQICGDAFTREWSVFRIKPINTYGCYKLFVYEFPEPREIPEARYGAVWIDTSTRQAEYYTLEYSLDNRWVLGSMTEKQHANYGNIDSPDLKRFILWILESNKEPECTLKHRDEDSEPVN